MCEAYRQWAVCAVPMCPCAAIMVSQHETVPHKILSKNQAELVGSCTYSTNQAHSQAEVQVRVISDLWPAMCGRKTSKMSNEGKCYVAVVQSHSEQVSCFTLQVLHECMICSSFSLVLSLAVPIFSTHPWRPHPTLSGFSSPGSQLSLLWESTHTAG